MNNIPIKDKISYLGISVCINLKDRCSFKFSPIIEETHRNVTHGCREICLWGEEYFQTFTAQSLHADNNTLKSIGKMLFNFKWENSIFYIENSDFCTFNNTLKINWAKYLPIYQNPTSTWNFILRYIFSKFGGLILYCFAIIMLKKIIPTKFSNFHKQVLLTRSLLYKHFSPHKYFIWSNRDILY